MRSGVILAAIALAGCNTSRDSAVSTAPSATLPANYRSVVAERAKTVYLDPYSLRDALISQPIPGTSLMGTTSTICVKANAKNKFGVYTGPRAAQFVFRDGVIALVDQETAAITCAAATYEPFPELEGTRS